MGKIKKILFVSTMGGSSWGGSEELWSQAASSLLRRGRFSVHAHIKKWSHESQRINQLRLDGAEISYWKNKNSLILRLQTLFQRSNTFVHSVKTYNPDLIVNSNGGAVPSMTLAKNIMASGKPYITMCQSNHSDGFFSDDVAEFYKFFFEAAAANVFIARANLNLLEAQLGTRLPNTEIVQNPVGLSLKNIVFPVPLSGSDEVARFASVARLQPSSKGQDLLLGVLSSEKWRSRPWVLNFYGDGPQLRTLQRLAGIYDLSERVTFCGHADDIGKIWQDHDVLLLPSRYEGMPLALIEAMRCGRPAVATAVGDIAELIEDGVTGFLADAATPLHVDAALERLWQSKTNWRTMGQAAHDKVEDWLADDPAEALADLLIRHVPASA